MARTRPKTKREKVWDKSGGVCWYCGKTLVLNGDRYNDPCSYLTMDHFIPRTSGGRGMIDNIVPCCPFCNSSKNKRTLERMRRSLAKAAGIVLFDADQLAYLGSLGIRLPAVDMPMFHFEKMGWTLSQTNPEER